MKLIPRRLQKKDPGSEQGLPGGWFSGRVRISTVVLLVAFLAVWWLYLSYQHSSESGRSHTPATQVVPPGFIPDPDYTWVPRARLEQPPITVTETEIPPAVTQTVTPPPEFPAPPFGPPPPALEPGHGKPPGPGRRSAPEQPPGPQPPQPPP